MFDVFYYLLFIFMVFCKVFICLYVYIYIY